MWTHPTQTRDGTRSAGVIIRCIEGGLTGRETVCDGSTGTRRGIFEIVRGVEGVGRVALTGCIETSEGGGIVGCWT